MRHLHIIKISPVTTRQGYSQKEMHKHFGFFAEKSDGEMCHLSPQVHLASPAERQHKSHEEFGQCQLNSRPLLHRGSLGVLSSSLFYKTVRGEEARTEHPKCPAQSLSPASELPGSWRFLQRCPQLTPCSRLFSQVPCKIGVACNHSNSISGVCKLFKCRCKLYSQRQAESLLKIYILNLFVFYNPNVFFQLFFTFFLTVFHSLPSPLYLGGGVLARAMQIVNRQQFLKSYK